ncbi:MAG: hypothetical protein PHV82_18275, partial [Victivallaceae bacterium]|nr:hypothetical protein [Victivallaceae bacterium]
YTMLNGFDDNFFIVPWLDVLGSETGLDIVKSSVSARTRFYQKPLLTLLKGDFARKLQRREIELFMKHCMLYGIIPGFFDWPPSGLGPGGRYWDHAAYYERDRELFRKYLPLCIELAKTGWEPLTHIKSSCQAIHIERFGKGNGKMFWFTVHNTGNETQDTKFDIDLKELGFTTDTQMAVYEILSEKPVPFTRNTNSTLSVKSRISAGEIQLFQAGRPEMIFDWWKDRAADVIGRGIRMRELDGNKPPLLVHWINAGKVYQRVQEPSGAKTPVLTRGCEFGQWSMLFQENAGELTLRVKVKAAGLENKKQQDTRFQEQAFALKPAAGIYCECAWVTSQFAHYERRFFPFPDGTYDWKDIEFKIKSSKPLRSINLSAVMGETAKGKLAIAEISLKDKKGNEYIVDPGFKAWYESQPAVLKDRIEDEMKLLKDKIGDLSRNDKNPEKLFEIYALCDKTLNEIKAAGAENGCRRVIRDIETVKTCLNYCLRIAAGINIPRLTGPDEASPGEKVRLNFLPAAFPDKAFMVTRTINGKKLAAAEPGCEITIPADAVIGSTFSVNGVSAIVAKSGEFDISAVHEIRIVLPFSASVVNKYADCANSEYIAVLELTNNSRLDRDIELKIAPQAEMKFRFPAVTKLSPLEKKNIKISMDYKQVEKIKNFAVKIKVSDGNYSKELAVPVFVIPEKANLVKNPAFENGLKHWWHSGKVTLAEENGQAVLQIENTALADGIAQQGVVLNQKTPTAFYIKAAAKGSKISGARDKGYSLYADIGFTDGSKWYGRTYNFKTGTGDWEEGLIYIEPEKPVKGVSVNLCLRKKRGTACFDNIVLAEDARRRNNIAPAAKVSADSSYKEYSARPVNDRKIQTAGLAYYEHSWCSKDRLAEHYIAFDFAEPVTLGKINIFWSLEGKEPMTSRKIFFQLWNNGSWKTVKEICR